MVAPQRPLRPGVGVQGRVREACFRPDSVVLLRERFLADARPLWDGCATAAVEQTHHLQAAAGPRL